MTPEQQRIKIAKACPTTIKFELGIWKWKHPNGTWCTCLWGDPLADLNAMHEAEKLLDANQSCLYRKLLDGITSQSYVGSETPQLCFGQHATAYQRAEAFLCTLNLWTD